MQHLFIKRSDDGGFNYAMTTNNHFNLNYKKLNEYVPSDSELQVISNKKFLIFYEDVYRLEVSFLKMLFEDELKEREALSLEDVRYELVHKVKEKVKECHRLNEADKENDKRDMVNGNIIIVSNESIISIDTSFGCEIHDLYFDNGELVVEIDKEISGITEPLELMDFYFEDCKKKCFYLNYPIVYGNTNNESVFLKGIEGNILELKKEDFVCHW